MAHKSQKLQFEIVAVLGLLALFTHIHMFWIAGLLLAMIDLPDFSTPLRSIAELSREDRRSSAAGRCRLSHAEDGRPRRPLPSRTEEREAPASTNARCAAMLELMLCCSMLTILPDLSLPPLSCRAKRFGHEITLFSVWFELRFGIVDLPDAARSR
mgnify:CR=1 FL=1